MSWQDDLRKLDDELAAGRISADEYRVRRDRVLSSAVSPPSQDSAASEATQLVPVPVPVQPPGPAQPPPAGAPPMPGKPPASDQTDDADKTQVVPGQTASDGDRTQAVGGWQTARPGDPDRTHVVPGVPRQTLAGGQPPRPAPPPSPPGGFPQPPWQQQYDEMSPPWAGSEFPPLAATGTPDWIKQGPEVFEEGRGGGNAVRVVAIIASVVVLVGIAFGAYWIWGRGTDNNNAGGGSTSTASTPTTTPSPKPPPDPLPVGQLPGKVTENRAVKTFADVPGQSYLTQPEIEAYTAGKGGKTKLVLSDVGEGNRLVVMLVQTPDAASAAATAAALNQIQIVNGMAQSTGSPAKVLVVTRPAQGDQKGRLRAHYAHGDIVVRVDLTTSASSDGVTEFNDILASQLEVLPADG